MSCKFFKHILPIAVSSLLFNAGCSDELRYPDYKSDTNSVTIQLDYMPLSESKVTTRTNDNCESSMSAVNDVCIVLFDTDGNYYKHFDLSEFLAAEQSVDRTNDDAAHNKIAGELTTKRLVYNISELYGTYYAYAVANLGSNGQKSSEYLSSKNIASINRDAFRNLRIKWDAAVLGNNNAMSGILTSTEKPGCDIYTIIPDDPRLENPVTFTPGATIHCWLRRLVSKVTVDFDASGLAPSTTIYIKDIRIRDIAYDCSLISGNKVEPKGSYADQPKDVEQGLLSDGNNNQMILICADNAVGTDDEIAHKNWPFLTAGIPNLREFKKNQESETKGIDRSNIEDDPHSNTAHSLYFFENMQGIHSDCPKLADVDAVGNAGPGADGVIDSPLSIESTNPDYKDRIYAGTYVEVEAYYRSIDKRNEGEGRIIYRFMLGQNETDDYNCERNHHYKLTLKFNGYANDVDWHIEYDLERPPYSMPDEYYITYDYGGFMEFPITISGDLVDNAISAEIVRNDWGPSVMWSDTKPAGGTIGASSYFEWYNGTLPKTNPLDINDVSYGFLSLRKTQRDVVGKEYKASKADAPTQSQPYLWKLWCGEGDNDETRDDFPRVATTDDHVSADDKAKYFNLSAPSGSKYKSYDYDKVYAGKRCLGYRVYSFSDINSHNQKTEWTSTTGNDIETQDGEFKSYTISAGISKSDGTKGTPRQSVLYIPMYTRERNIIKTTGYTGMNPYKEFQRRAVVRFRFKVKKIDGTVIPCVKDVNIIQVAKLNNPIAVWREWNNARSFHVQLKYHEAGTTHFTDLTSHEGGWSAEVEYGSDWILLNGGKRKVTGDKGSPIQFDYRPAGILSSPNQVRCGVILIKYHNYSCTHRIFVRQGYAPLSIHESLPKIHTGNMVTKNQEATDPCDEGSLFRYGKTDDPIKAKHNVPDKSPWINVVPTDYKDHSNATFEIAGTSKSKKWTDIGSVKLNKTDGSVWDNIRSSGTELLRHEDIVKMRDDNITRFGFGVLYSGKASTTMHTLDEAYGYLQEDANTHTYGMRGCIVHNPDDGRNIFFPIGRSGYGKRKNTAGSSDFLYTTIPAYLAWANYPEVGTAIVRYAAGRITYMDSETARYQPLLWDIFRSDGAGYWFDKVGDGDRTSLDLNQKTFEFNSLGTEPFQGKDDTSPNKASLNRSDALYIRLVTP